MNHMKKTDCILYVQKFNMDQTHLEDILEYLILKSILNNWIFVKKKSRFLTKLQLAKLMMRHILKIGFVDKKWEVSSKVSAICVTPSGNTLCPKGQRWFIHFAVIFFDRRVTFTFYSDIRRLKIIFVVRPSTFHQEQ